MRKPPGRDIRIARYSARWHSEIVALADEIFGKGFFDLSSAISDESGVSIFVNVDREGSPVGFACGRILAKGKLSEMLLGADIDISADIAKADTEGALGVIETVGVAREYRAGGIGTSLVTAVHDTLVGEGADKVMVVFKRNSNATPVEGMMQRLGFEFWTRLPTFWKQPCDNGAFRCVDRLHDCSCSALLYRKTVY